MNGVNCATQKFGERLGVARLCPSTRQGAYVVAEFAKNFGFSRVEFCKSKALAASATGLEAKPRS